MADDRDDTPIPEPDAPETATERAAAESFAGLVDRMLTGERLPPAMDQDERALLEVATVVRAASGDVPLEDDRTGELIEDVFAQLAGRTGPRPAAGEDEDEDGDERDGGGGADVTPLRPRRLAAVLPWVATAVAVAAAIALWVTRPDTAAQSEPVVVVAPAEPLEIHRSRPADPLVGRIDQEEADAASSRIDVIYADRLAGYRDLRMRGSGATKGEKP